MTYGDVHGSNVYKGSEIGPLWEVFAEADRVFLNWNSPLHGTKEFEKIFPFDESHDWKILEVGCGLGKMASLWSSDNNLVTAVDLNLRSLELAKKRFELMRIDGAFLQADGRSLPFSDDSFDYVYSWGVLHHSPDLEASLSEVLRCLKPGHRFGIMLYRRRSLLYRYWIRYIEGFLHEESRHLSDLELTSRYGDGAREEGNPYTRPVSESEIKRMLAEKVSSLEFRVLGTDLDSILKYAMPGLGSGLPLVAKKSLARRFGWSLWISGRKV
jgi:SAM-dependent methyltransferase